MRVFARIKSFAQVEPGFDEKGMTVLKAAQAARIFYSSGGDIITGAATVISAMGAGKRAAASIDEYLRGV